jgi:Casein kinase II regulatory subunit
MLYGLIHQRWIISKGGLQAMVTPSLSLTPQADKYEHAAFGHCPRVFCHSTAVIPMGRSDCQAIDTVKLFCPSCLDIYTPPQSRFAGVDGQHSTSPTNNRRIFWHHIPPFIFLDVSRIITFSWATTSIWHANIYAQNIRIQGLSPWILTLGFGARAKWVTDDLVTYDTLGRRTEDAQGSPSIF